MFRCVGAEETCTDGVRFLRSLQLHFSGIRSVRRRVDDYRRAARFEEKCQNVLTRGTYTELDLLANGLEFPPTEEEKMKEVHWIAPEKRYAAGVEADIKKGNAKELAAFKKAVDSFPRKHCESCLRVTPDKELVRVSVSSLLLPLARNVEVFIAI